MNTTAAQDVTMRGSRAASQGLWFLFHALVSVLAWGTLVFAVTLMQPSSVPPLVTLALSFIVPLVAGFIVVRVKPDEIATVIWLAGLVWFLMIGLWVLDMPTGPGACFHCDASQKLWLTFFSLDQDSGLLDGQGRFLGTWPAVAMIAYSIGARVSLNRIGTAESI